MTDFPPQEVAAKIGNREILTEITQTQVILGITWAQQQARAYSIAIASRILSFAARRAGNTAAKTPTTAATSKKISN